MLVFSEIKNVKEYVFVAHTLTSLFDMPLYTYDITTGECVGNLSIIVGPFKCIPTMILY